MDIYEAEKKLSDLNLGRMRMILKGNNPDSSLLKEIEKTRNLLERLKKEELEFFNHQQELREKQKLLTLRNLTEDIHKISFKDFKDWSIKNPLDCYQNFCKIASSLNDLEVTLEDQGKIFLKTEADGKKSLTREYFNWDRATFEMTFYISPKMLFDDFKKSVSITKIDFERSVSHDSGRSSEESYIPRAIEIIFHLLKCFEKI